MERNVSRAVAEAFELAKEFQTEDNSATTGLTMKPVGMFGTLIAATIEVRKAK